MSQTAAIWLVIVAAFLAANLPFVNERWLLAGPRPQQGSKPLWARLGASLLLCLAVAGMALALEHRAEHYYPSGRESHAVTCALFFTLAFPRFFPRPSVLHPP